MNTESADNEEYSFPKDDNEAGLRFEKFEHIDPLPDIASALLNSSDIYDYARITGMICPFADDRQVLEKKLKPASYEIDFLGEVYFIDGKGKKRGPIMIEKDTPFKLPKNSIAFVALATKFRLPDYIALRFNLKITHVHRGLLLGTGPLVDPGFAGQLLIPLHNLTSDDYTLIGGEGLIWVEFTKLSPHWHWDQRARKNSTVDYMHFNPKKRYQTAQQYFNKASNGKPSASSIPETLQLAEAAVSKINKIAWFGGIAGMLTIVGLVGTTWSLISDANKNVADASRTISDYRKTVDELQIKVDALESQAPTELLRPETKFINGKQPSVSGKQKGDSKK